jgi:SAM-dependent methyltransferase
LADGLLDASDLGGIEPHYPLNVVFCSACSLVQLRETVAPEVVFGEDYPYYSSFSDALMEHSRRNVERLIAERALGVDSLAVELASNDGYLLRYFVKDGIPVLGIDPAAGPAQAAEAAGIPTLQAFFGRDLAVQLAGEGHRADVVVANNVLAHVADTNGFVAGIGIMLKEAGVAVIEVPYLRDLVDNCEFDTIYHEHLCYFSVTALDRLFTRHGLSLNRVEHYPIHGGSLRFFVEPQVRVQDSVRRYLEEESEAGLTEFGYYADFADKVEAIKDELRALLETLKAEGKRIAAYGAAAKGATLLNYTGVGRAILDFVADRNVHKQGRFMPGVHLAIRSPKAILEEMPDYLLLLAWNHRDEIMAQQAEYRRRGGRFVVPIPSPEVVA